VQHSDDAHDLSPEPGRNDAGADLVSTAFRRALDAPSPAPGVLLAGVEARAERHQRAHRRMLAGTTVAVAAAAAGVVALTTVLGPGGGTGGGLPPAASSPSSRQSSPSVPSRAPTSAPVLPSAPVVVPSSGAPGPTADHGPHAAADGVDPLLTPEQVTAFGGVALTSQHTDLTAGDPSVVAGACTDQAVQVDRASSAWRGDWTPATPPAAGATPVGLVETVWRWDDASQAQQVMAAVTADAVQCEAAGAASEGHSTPVQQDAATVTPRGGTALVLTQTGGTGEQEVQVVLVKGGTLVRLQASGVPAGDGAGAVQALADTARSAATRAFGADLAAS
jgi:hypothetical protein